tara:strand:- start:111 stop:212 length:102 start_codon:yes stop_codon:yes gene_type:complete
MDEKGQGKTVSLAIGNWFIAVVIVRSINNQLLC